jgi:hypothetical protein
MDRFRRLDHAGGLELDVFADEVLEHPGAAPEEHRHEVDPDLIHQTRLDELPPDLGAAHHGDVLVPGRLRLFERAFDAVRDKGVHTPFGDSLGRLVGEDEHPGRWVRAVRAPPRKRVVVGTAPGDDRSRVAIRLGGEDFTVRSSSPKPHWWSRSPPSPSGCSGVAFEAFTNPSSDMLMSKITLII